MADIISLNVASFNCRGYNNSKRNYVRTLLSQVSVLFLQEIWLSESQMNELGSIDDNFLFAGCSGFDNSDVLTGRPYGGVAIAVRIAAGLRLGTPIVCPHVCVCGKSVAVDGHQGLSCRFGFGRHSRHNQINDELCRAFIKSGSLATREPHSLCTGSGK